MHSYISSDLSDDSSCFGSPKEKMLRNSNIFKQPGLQGVCPKHPNKKAKYYAESDKSQLFCSKCALTMALRGLRIEETPSQEENLRKERISAFTSTLGELILSCETKFNSYSDLSAKLKQNYNHHRDRCTLYFDQMLSKISQLKQSYLSKLSTTFTNQLQELQQMTTTIKTSETQLKQFLVDIEKNRENIVKRMEMKPFTDIMDRYDKRVDEHSKTIHSLNYIAQPSEIKEITKESIESEINTLCERLLKYDYTEEEEVYQSTCANSRSMSNIKLSKPSQSPMRLPPFPKSSQTLHQSGINTPDSSKQPRRILDEKTIIKIPNQADELLSDRNSESRESPRQSSKQEYYENSTLMPQRRTPTHLKHQSYQAVTQIPPQLNTSQQGKSSSSKKLPVWSGDVSQMQVRKIELNNKENNIKRIKQEPSKSEGKRNFLLPHEPEETLKDRIFRELSGAESIYSQVLKVKKPQPPQPRFIKNNTFLDRK